MKNPLDCKTKKAALAAVYRIAEPITQGIFKDNSWEPVSKLFRMLREIGCSVSINSADYQHDDKGTPNGKTWKIEITAGTFVFNGALVAMGAGSVADPLDRYDLALCIG